MASEKIPEANPLLLQQVDAMREDPVAYLRRERAESLRTARDYVDQRVSMKLAEQRSRRMSFAQRVLHILARVMRVERSSLTN